MNTQAHLRNTELTDRTLWYDGDSSFDPSKLNQFLRLYNVRYVDHIDDSVREYNAYVSADQELSVKTSSRPLDLTWNIPPEYQTLNVVEYITEKHLIMTAGMDADECDARDARLAEELTIYHNHGLFDILRSVIYVINTLLTHNIVWGVGRGSSVSSYVLYVIGVHDVDSFFYDLDIRDFITE